MIGKSFTNNSVPEQQQLVYFQQSDKPQLNPGEGHLVTNRALKRLRNEIVMNTNMDKIRRGVITNGIKTRCEDYTTHDYLQRLQANVHQVHKQPGLQLQQQHFEQLAHRQERVGIATQHVQPAPQLAKQQSRHGVQRRAVLDDVTQWCKVRGKAQKGLHGTGRHGSGGRESGLQFVQ